MAISQPIVGQPVSVELWGKPITDEVNRITPLVASTAWADLTLTNGWVNLGAPRANTSWRLLGGFCILRIGMKNGTSGASCFTLPAAARPSYYIDTQVRCESAMGWLNFDSSGNAVVFVAAGGANTFVGGLVVYPLV